MPQLNFNKILKKLNTPSKVQDFLDTLPFNFEKDCETYLSPKKVLEQKTAHCFEGATFAAACLGRAGVEHYLLDLKVKDLKKDSDHCVCIFKINGYWGAISKTNHSVLRWRDPIYKSYRELALSYFHEYFLDTGHKTLASFSKPFDVWKRFGDSWVEGEEELDHIAEALDAYPHINFVPEENKKMIRNAGKTEIAGAAVTEW
jgi:hypothetical protein